MKNLSASSTSKVLRTLFNYSLTLSLLLCLSIPAHAEDELTDDGGFLEFNFGYSVFNSRFVDAPDNDSLFLNLHLNFRWNGFFIENKGDKGLGKAGAGYNFYNNQDWSFDAYITEIHDEIDPNSDYIIGNVHAGLIGIEFRDSDQRLGLRATRYLNSSTALRFFIAPIGSHGVYAGAWLGRTWQHKNFNFYAISSLQYHATKTLDYYYGVHPQESSDKFPQYQASGGITLTGEMGVTYPLSKDWIIESSFKVTRLPSSIYHSPLIDNKVEPVAKLSLTYVLF
ncbi:MipA/OmpV family protein [Alteromonadaceae bacterium BrNp21-10]|nr:MipA/OmpV family protein [Alteromonadaceae bacterium BrNp21-10]